MEHIDLAMHLGATVRSVQVLEREGKPARGVTLERVYDTNAADLWDAVTNPERLPRWFAPVSGDLKLGGRYQVEGNASGTITACVEPSTLDLTWEFGGGVSWVEVRIASEAPEQARLTLSHVALLDEEHWPTYGPGAAGLGWDLAFLGLALHFSGRMGDRSEGEAFMTSPDGKRFMRGCAEAWGRAAIEAGEAPEQAEAAAQRTAAFYTGEPAPQG